MFEMTPEALSAFKDEMNKISYAAQKIPKSTMKTVKRLFPWVGGAAAALTLERAEHDRRLGRRVRSQSGG